MNKRDFLKVSSLIGIASAVGVPVLGNYKTDNSNFRSFRIPPLKFNSLPGFIDKDELRKEQQAVYNQNIQTLNQDILNSGRCPKNAVDILQHPHKFHSSTVNHCCVHYNEKRFWRSLTPQQTTKEPFGQLGLAITRDFGSIEKFKTRFTQTALKASSGEWVWLIANNGILNIVTTSENENPLLSTLPKHKKGQPILGLKSLNSFSSNLGFNNNKELYLEAFFSKVDWAIAEKRYVK